jgi:hypothetical protein
MSARYKTKLCGRSIAGIVGSNPADDMDVRLLVSVVYCVGSGLCDELIPNSEESYRVFVYNNV